MIIILNVFHFFITLGISFFVNKVYEVTMVEGVQVEVGSLS